MPREYDDFTAKRVDELACEPGQDQTIHWDGHTHGLGLRVTKAGFKAYIFQASLHGRAVRVTIGKPGTWPVGAARAEANRLRVLIDQGTDPRKVAADQKAAADAARRKEKSEGVLVRDAWEVYLRDRTSHWGARHLLDHQRSALPGGQAKKRGDGETVAGVLHPLMAMRMADVSADVIIKLLKAEAASRRAVAKTGFKLFRTFWSWCADQDEYSAVVDIKLLTNRKLRDEVPKDRAKLDDVLQRAHLKPWFAAARAMANPVLSAFLQSLILTGARLEEMAQLRWEDIDFKYGSMRLKDKIEASGRQIPLTPYVAQLIGALPRRNEWVFSSERAGDGRIRQPRKAHNQVLAAGALKHVSLHGLRRTFSSLAEWLEIPYGIKAQIMGHKPSATAEKHYNYRPLELLAIWHEKYEAWILQEAGIKLPGKLPSKRKRKKSAPKARRPPLRLVVSR